MDYRDIKINPNDPNGRNPPKDSGLENNINSSKRFVINNRDIPEIKTIAPYYNVKDCIKDKTHPSHWELTSRFTDSKYLFEIKHWCRPKNKDDIVPIFRNIEQVFQYKDDEYRDVIPNGWTREQTDHLFTLCHKYELRWPIISDRYNLIPHRSIQDCKQRYFTVTKTILEKRKEKGLYIMDNDLLTYQYSYTYDVLRNNHLHKMFTLSKVEEKELDHLKKELNVIDAMTKKSDFKNKGSFGLKDDDIPEIVLPKDKVEIMEELEYSLTPPLQSGVSLRSSRFDLPYGKTNPTIQLLICAQQVLLEIGLPSKIMATQMLCDLYDKLRQDAIKLILLSKQVLSKEVLHTEASTNETKKRKLASTKGPKTKKIKYQNV